MSNRERSAALSSLRKWVAVEIDNGFRFCCETAEENGLTYEVLDALLDERDHYRAALEHLHSPGRRQDLDQGRGLTHYIGDVLRHVE